MEPGGFESLLPCHRDITRYLVVLSLIYLQRRMALTTFVVRCLALHGDGDEVGTGNGYLVVGRHTGSELLKPQELLLVRIVRKRL